MIFCIFYSQSPREEHKAGPASDTGDKWHVVEEPGKGAPRECGWGRNCTSLIWWRILVCWTRSWKSSGTNCRCPKQEPGPSFKNFISSELAFVQRVNPITQDKYQCLCHGPINPCRGSEEGGGTAKQTPRGFSETWPQRQWREPLSSLPAPSL